MNNGWIYTDRIMPESDGVEILEFYRTNYSHSDEKEWRHRLQNGMIRLNGKVTTANQCLRCGDILAYHRPPWTEAAVPADYRVLYRDGDLIAVHKPAGLPVLPGGNFLQNTLLMILLKEFPEKPVPVHRLGRGTSGLILFALSPGARQFLSRLFRNGEVKKVYRTLVQGLPGENRFTITAPIGRVPYPFIGEIFAAAPAGKPAKSVCRILEKNVLENRSLIEVELITGRPHQIRIHLAAAGFPLYGDPLYRPGGLPHLPKERPALPGDGGYFLHSMRISFPHPKNGRRLYLTDPPPRELQTGEELQTPPKEWSNYWRFEDNDD